MTLFIAMVLPTALVVYTMLASVDDAEAFRMYTAAMLLLIWFVVVLK